MFTYLNADLIWKKWLINLAQALNICIILILIEHFVHRVSDFYHNSDYAFK